MFKEKVVYWYEDTGSEYPEPPELVCGVPLVQGKDPKTIEVDVGDELPETKTVKLSWLRTPEGNDFVLTFAVWKDGVKTGELRHETFAECVHRCGYEHACYYVLRQLTVGVGNPCFS